MNAFTSEIPRFYPAGGPGPHPHLLRDNGAQYNNNGRTGAKEGLF